MDRQIAVIGAGPAGMMAAGRAAERGCKVTLYEKNDRVGKKILISGKGRCNITNNTDVEGLIENTPGNGTFLYSSFYSFSNHDLIQFLNSRGLQTKDERGGRVFPLSDRAKDVADAMEDYCRESGVRFRFESTVRDIIISDCRVKGLILEDGTEVSCDAVVLATGGLSYPRTGSTGDGYRMAKKIGHTLTPMKPSLVPLITAEEWVKELQGLSLKNIAITMLNEKNKKVYSDFGEMVFTHYGVSGPVILSGSRHILDYGYRNIRLSIDLKPALSEEKLDDRLLRDFEQFSRKQFKNSLGELLPQKMIPVMVELSQIPGDKFVNQITKEERKRLVKLFKGLTMTIIGARPIGEAIVTAGGIATDEVDPSTMESKLVAGLYFAGEIIDVDAYTGGFNLTIAFSTGHLAGSSC